MIEIIVKNGSKKVKTVEIIIYGEKYIFIDKAALLLANKINTNQYKLRDFVEMLTEAQLKRKEKKLF